MATALRITCEGCLRRDTALGGRNSPSIGVLALPSTPNPSGATRARLEATITRLVALLDALDGDPDLEADCDLEAEADEASAQAVTLAPDWFRPRRLHCAVRPITGSAA